MYRSKFQLRADRERVAWEAEASFSRNNLQPAFREIKRLSSVPAKGVNTLLQSGGTVVVDYEGYRD